LRILKEQFTKEKRKDKLKEMDGLLSGFTTKNLEKQSARDMVKQGKEFLGRN
jgi:pyridoxal/pyridoxine/pyridoxamine kinase